MEIAKARIEDLNEIMEVYDAARRFMRLNGNMNQWINGYPQPELVRQDIENGNLYVCRQTGMIAGAFAFIIGQDPTYSHVEGGSWHSDQPYGTIHRLGSNGCIRGVGKACFDYCKSAMDYLRADTHQDNIPMQRVLEANGFRRCGIIYLLDGSPRIAYDWHRREQ
ncbi:MAG: GNAT family N-acetyltransferase [Erysipelotrichaceae bacterium]|nr:GNAT family N-acetyltransferase [Erysipelotrichaceae bacterium]